GAAPDRTADPAEFFLYRESTCGVIVTSHRLARQRSPHSAVVLRRQEPIPRDVRNGQAGSSPNLGRWLWAPAFAGRRRSACAHHGLQIIVRLDDLDQAVFGRTVAAIGVGMVLLDQSLVLVLDVFQGRVRTEPHHLQRLALGIEDLSGLGFGRGVGTRAEACAAATELGEHAEGIGGTIEFGSRCTLAFPRAAVGAHLPGWTMAGHCVLLVTRDRIGVHAGEEIVGLVVLTHMVETVMPIFTRVLAALGGAMRALVLAA